MKPESTLLGKETSGKEKPGNESSGNENRRRASREPVADTLFIQTIGADQVTAVGADLKTGNTINASAYGMQVELDFEMLVDSEIALWVTMPSSSQRVMINGTVRWTSRSMNADRYMVGIELSEEAVPEMQRWLADRQAH